MNTRSAIEHAGTTGALASLLGITSAAVSQWGEYPPDVRQLQIERVTLGALKAEPGCLDRVLGLELKAA
jgi:DNA-binding transcriptional regulator YdaS (Cro superfamily)